MSLERDPVYKTPTQAVLFHLDDDGLRRNFPEWYERHYHINNQGFNSQYAADSTEIEIIYNQELVEQSFAPLIKTIERYVEPLQGSRLLEIGGSSGLLAKNLQNKGATITMVETQKNFVQRAKERGVADSRIYDGVNLTKVISGEKFEAVIASRVFEDVVMSEQQAMVIIRQIKAALEPSGLIIIGTQRQEAVWHHAIIRGSQLDLLESIETHNNQYLRQVLVYGKKND